MNRKALACFFLLGFTIIACSSSDSDDSNGGGATGETQGTVSSCDLTADGGYCVEFTADAQKGVAQGNCDSSKATIGWTGIVRETEGCPAANSVGTCVVQRPIDPKPFTNRYYAPKFTTATAQENCNGDGIKGTFTPN